MPADALSVLRERPFVALTGAGLSTDSGIPDYRGPTSVARMPMTYQEFVAGAASQQRYWARAHIGWSRMRDAAPNAGHLAMTQLENLDLLITQNVDGLHERAGQPRLIALHGRISEVICLDCRNVSGRQGVQAQMLAENPGYLETHADAEVRPDGDVDLSATDGFTVPACQGCGGRLKPDVVFFGENVPKERVLHAQAAVDATEALLVVGSSLTVMSGLRFVRQAAKRSIPVVIVNRGVTRGDDLATYKIEAGCSEFLSELASPPLIRA